MVYYKKSKYFTNEPEHILDVIKSSRFFSEIFLRFIDPLIERNTFFDHPENLLMSMIIDKSDHRKL